MKTNKIILISCNLLIVLGCGTYKKKKLDEKIKPNIIYILSDDLGYGDLGSYGQTRKKHPISIKWRQRV